ncbi:hypothetical protein [Nitrosomonas sp. ANs5]|uniref:hypothetical protein n=1 Tax=Nitrosomonas sp. ANs5 TaxID=3423941 RepID=UPI003D343131
MTSPVFLAITYNRTCRYTMFSEMYAQAHPAHDGCGIRFYHSPYKLAHTMPTQTSLRHFPGFTKRLESVENAHSSIPFNSHFLVAFFFTMKSTL